MVSLLLAAKDRQYSLNEIKYSFVAWYIHSHVILCITLFQPANCRDSKAFPWDQLFADPGTQSYVLLHHLLYYYT